MSDERPWRWQSVNGFGIKVDAVTGEMRSVTSPYHFIHHGQQRALCGVCDCGPCPGECPAQELPDRLEYKAKRAGKDVVTWLQEHLEYAERVMTDPQHARHAELKAILVRQGPLEEPEREIPIGRAMALAGAVYARQITPEQAQEALRVVR